MKYDLLIKNGRVVDYLNNLDRVSDIGIKDGKILEVGEELNPNYALQVIDAKDKLVIPGIIDTYIY